MWKRPIPVSAPPSPAPAVNRGRLSRRGFLGGALSVGAGWSWFVAGTQAHTPASGGSSPKRALRLAQFSDTHVGVSIPFSEPGFTQALQHAHRLKDPPQMILMTGDLITDAFWTPEAEALAHWKLFKRVLEKHCTLPVRYCLGNHDVHGWGNGNTTSPLAGPAMFKAQLGLDRTYYSFDLAGWHFIVLDDIRRGGWNGFMHYLDDEQMAWLKEDLRRTPSCTPVLIASHAPILCVTCFFEDPPRQFASPEGWFVSYDCVHRDVAALKQLFTQHPNVKLCLSGHYHQVDHCQYLGVHYICGGAVSGSYWRGPNPPGEFEAGYGLVDLYEDGTFNYHYVDYGLVGYQDKPDRPRYPWPRE